MIFFKKKPAPNAICPYCLSLTSIQPGERMTCGFCESELMRAMNFFVPLNEYLSEHSIEELQDMFAQAQNYLKTCTTKSARFYAKDHIASIKELLKIAQKR